jgi:AraC-like DNA-binding protein
LASECNICELEFLIGFMGYDDVKNLYIEGKNKIKIHVSIFTKPYSEFTICVFLTVMEDIVKDIFWLTGIMLLLCQSALFLLSCRQTRAFLYAGLLFGCVFVNCMDAYVDRHLYFWAGMITNTLLPLTITLIPFFTIFYMYSLASPGKSLPRWSFYFYAIPALFFVYSGYVHLVRFPFETIRENFYSLTALGYKQPDFKAFVIISKIRTYYTLAGVLVIMISSIFFIPRILKMLERQYPGIREQFVNSFLGLLSIGVIISVVCIVYYVTHRYYFYTLMIVLTGIAFSGYIMYKKLVLKTIAPEAIGSSAELPLAMRITMYFDQAKPWQEPGLKIEDVASAMGTNRTYLSALMNDEFQTSFNHFVNSYRIAEAKKLLLSTGEQVKLQEIAIKSGFNSYSTFFSAFRKETGMSPKEFIEGKL